jgi:2-C-methyl-D-erythritol 4-phosphate cytidylyltransferase
MSVFKKLLKSAFRYISKKEHIFCSAVIVAAGSASRMQGTDKIMADLAGEPVICHTLRSFEDCSGINEIIIVTREDLIPQIRELCHKCNFKKVTSIVPGGNSRLTSVLAGLACVSSVATHAAIHDGARPLVRAKLIERTLQRAEHTGAAAPAVAVKDTIKSAQGGIVTNTLKRSELFAVQTPQIFDRDLLMGALSKANQEQWDVTDDCSAVEMLGMSVHLVAGDEENIKITTPADLTVAEALLKGRGETL